MGCCASRNDTRRLSTSLSTATAVTPSAASPSGNMHGQHGNHPEDEIDYKARLERKICLAKETPEPDFDLSSCNLKEVPSGVYIQCRVLRKETLDLGDNRLHSLVGGGQLTDLGLLQVLNLNSNRLHKLPNDIFRLENLRELLLSRNLLERLPDTINRLSKLELLDLSHNNLVDCSSINCMRQLRVLNLTDNRKLTKLPALLGTCDSLDDLVVDLDQLEYPPPEVTRRGTREVIRFLQAGSVVMDLPLLAPLMEDAPTRTQRLIERERNERSFVMANDKYSREKAMLEHERQALEKNAQLEYELHNQQQKRKQQLLETLQQQQTENDTLVSKIQNERDSERSKLIGDILNAESKSIQLVENLLSLKTEPAPELLERERLEQEHLLDQLQIHHQDLRKQEILRAMTDDLNNETTHIELYQQQRDFSAREILKREQKMNTELADVYNNYDKNRMEVVEQIMSDEDLQKTAVATLIAKNDARIWGLVEQVRIVESQLAAMTHFEIERKKLSAEEQMNELVERRINLTYVLMDLLSQQENRKQQLLDTLIVMENQNRDQQQDFWLLQYQRLIDARPTELASDAGHIDPLLGYNFLVNGVVHCLPFLQRIWQTKELDLENICDADLIDAGVNKEHDRRGILTAITQFLNDGGSCCIGRNTASAPPLTPTNAVLDDQNNTGALQPREGSALVETLGECVVCMEELCAVIFVPCGHLCCCQNCQQTLSLCPMCRGDIERRIKVIQA